MQQILTEGSSYTEFYKVVELLKKFPVKYSNLKNFDEETENSEDFSDNIALSLISTFKETSDSVNLELNTKNNNSTDKQINGDQMFSTQHSDTNCEDIESNVIDSNDTTMNETEGLMKFKNLPVWICHSRPRIADDE